MTPEVFESRWRQWKKEYLLNVDIDAVAHGGVNTAFFTSVWDLVFYLDEYLETWPKLGSEIDFEYDPSARVAAFRKSYEFWEEVQADDALREETDVGELQASLSWGCYVILEPLRLKLPIMSALRSLLLQDGDLLDWGVNERSITHKLGAYLQLAMPDWDVDCEYNRMRDEDDLPTKKFFDTWVEAVNSNDLSGTTVFPDIIVHDRRNDRDPDTLPLDEDISGGRNPNNFLVIEVKKSAGNTGHDRKKLKAFTSRFGPFCYAHGLLITFKRDKGSFLPELTWFKPEKDPDGIDVADIPF